jgi:hypothetical protein
MSSDFLEDVKCNGTTTLLTMRASGFAELTILEPDMGHELGGIARFPLVPNKLGLENAEKIAAALRAWAEHVKLVGLV